MKLFNRTKKITATTTRDPMDWFLHWIRGGPPSDSGIEISGRSVMSYSAVWQATSIIAGDVGQLPLDVYERLDDGKQRCTDHPAQLLLRRRPNGMMNASTFKELLQSHALLWGNGRAGILRDGRANPIALIPFLPDRSHEQIIAGRLWHLTKLGDSTEFTKFRDEDVLHIKGLSFDGITGYSVISMARNSLGLGLAAEKHGNRNFKNNARPAVILETEGKFTRDAALTLLDDWERMYAGLDNVGRTALLQNGTKAKVLSMSNEDAQWLETRKFQRVEVASWFNLPPHMLGDDSQDGYNSVEMRNRSYIDRALMRWLVGWSEECHEKLLTEQQKLDDSHFVEFNTAALLRGDLTARYTAYQIGINSGFLAPDEARRAENLNDRPDGRGGEYKSPSGTPPEGEGSEEVEPTNAAGQGSQSALHNQAAPIIAEQIRKLLKVECNRVEAASGKAKNFLDWMDGFYSRWEATLARTLVDLGGEEWHAADYVAESRRRLLEQSDKSRPETFAADITHLVADWPARADQLAADICT